MRSSWFLLTALGVATVAARSIVWQERAGLDLVVDRSKYLAPLGFHGDLALLAVVSLLMSEYNVKAFVETGTYTGTTAAYMLRTYPQLSATFSCEVQPEFFEYARAEMVETSALYAHVEAQGPFILGMVLMSSVDMFNLIHEQYADVETLNTLFWVRQ
jgi:hypothetical protein